MRTRLVGCSAAVMIATLACALGVTPERALGAAPRVVWVAEWGLTLREGVDVVHAYGVYYRYDDGRWSMATSPSGPWRPAVVIPPGPPHATPSPSSAALPRERDVPSVSANRIVDVALRQLGVPYAWGGTKPTGFDCSGLVRYAFGAVGIELPHNVARQHAHGVPIAREDLQPGDVVFFDGLRHNGIYIGDSRFVHAARSPASVIVSRLDESWYQSRWVGARRLLPPASTVRR